MQLRNQKVCFVKANRLTAQPVKASNDDNPPPGADKAPKCPHCSTMTLWYESHLKRDNGRSKVVHSFHCPNCAAIVQIEKPFKQALRLVS